MSMTPEEKFNHQVWEILQDLKEEYLAAGELIRYKKPSVVGVGIIPWKRKVDILKRLQEWGALKIILKHSKSQEYGFEFDWENISFLDIKIAQPKFEEVYQEFENTAQTSEQIDEDLSEIKEVEVKDTPIRIVISDLNSIYQEIESEKNKVQFFIKIAHYGKYILENSSTVTVLDPLYKQSKEDVKPYLKSWGDFVKIWKKYSKDLLVKAEEAGIKDNPNDPTSNEISSIKSKLKEDETSVWETDLGYFYQPYQTLIWKFKDKNKSNLLTSKHVNKEDNSVVIYPIYQKARDEWDKFKYSREASVWWAHYQICRLAAGVLDLDIKEQYFKRDNIIDGFYKFEFKEVARGNINRSPIVLHQHKYSTWIKRLHNYLIPRLQELSNRPAQIRKGGVKHRTTKKSAQHKLPPGWKLSEDDNIPYIKKDSSVVFTFPNNWSNKYRYFKCLWESYGDKKDYKEVYEFESKSKYPEKNVWKVNKNIRTTVNKLRKEFEKKNLPIHIETNRGFTLTIS